MSASARKVTLDNALGTQLDWSPPEPELPQHRKGEVRSPGTVLVVDDDAAVLNLLQEALRDEGYSVIAADNAGDALDMLMTLWDRQPDAILLDVQLPTVGGQGFAELYRLLPVPQAPIILISASPSAPKVARQIQAQDVLSKPFDLEDLLSRLQRVTLGQTP